MSRFSVAGRSTVAGTTLRAIASLFATASVGGTIREVGVVNTTGVAVAAALVRFTNATGVGAGLTEVAHHTDGPGPNLTGFAGHTADGAVGAAIRQWVLGASAGSGIIWTFGDSGLVIQPGTANGVGIICPVGTGQILDYYIEWEE